MAFRGHPEFKKLLIDTGLAEYWRQTGKWGDSCKPVVADDFQCQFHVPATRRRGKLVPNLKRPSSVPARSRCA